jgi:hypothetical protein
LKLQAGAEDEVPGQYEGDGGLGKGREAKEVAALVSNAAKGTSEEGGKDGGGDFKDIRVKVGSGGQNKLQDTQ